MRAVLDVRNRPTAVTSTLVSTQSLAAGITYDPAGNPVALTLGNGILPAWGYDGANRVASITIPGIAALIYACDLSGDTGPSGKPDCGFSYAGRGYEY